MNPFTGRRREPRHSGNLDVAGTRAGEGYTPALKGEVHA